MSESHAALRALDTWIATLKRAAPPRAEPECVRLANAQNLGAAEALPSGDVLARLRQDLQRTFDAGGATNLPSRLLRNSPLVFWHGKDPAVAAIPGLLDQFVTGTLRGGQLRARWLTTLIEAWLRDFAPEKQSKQREAGRAISTLLTRSGSHPGLSKWRDADKTYAMFDAAEGPKRVADALLGAKQTPCDVLIKTGMEDHLRSAGGYFRAINEHMIRSLPLALHSADAHRAWTQFCKLSEVVSTATDARGRLVQRARLRFPDMSGAIATRSLEPWKSGGRLAPGPIAKKEVQEFLVRHLEDPRIHPQRWSDVEPWAVKLIRSWLSIQSVDAFIALISSNNDDMQWQYRKAFWLACRRKMPDNFEAWVILGSNLANKAGSLAQFTDSYGRMDGQNQAVLLLRLDRLVFCEWSNVGPVRAWLVIDPRCPPIKSIYSSYEFMKRCLDFPSVNGKGGTTDGKGLYHRSPERGLWQSCAAALIRQHLDVTLTWSDYKP